MFWFISSDKKQYYTQPSNNTAVICDKILYYKTGDGYRENYFSKTNVSLTVSLLRSTDSSQTSVHRFLTINSKSAHSHSSSRLRDLSSSSVFGIVAGEIQVAIKGKRYFWPHVLSGVRLYRKCHQRLTRSSHLSCTRKCLLDSIVHILEYPYRRRL